jgi:hypothetical protein
MPEPVDSDERLREAVVRALANVDGTFSRGDVANTVVAAVLNTIEGSAPGDTAHAWALDGPPLRNSDPDSASTAMLDCPKCSDVILDVVDVRSGPLSAPRNIHSTLGRVWYARCPACGWTSPDRPSEWTLLEAVTEARA